MTIKVTRIVVAAAITERTYKAMTRDEVKKIVFAIGDAYSDFTPKIATREAAKATIDSWFIFLADKSYEQILVGLKNYVDLSGSAFAPKISELIAYSTKVNELSVIDEVEAWNMVRKALGRSSYNSQSEFNKLPALVQQAVGSPGQLYSWSQDDHFNESVICSLFQKNYRTIVARSQQYDRLSQEQQLLIQQSKAEQRLMLENNQLDNSRRLPVAAVEEVITPKELNYAELLMEQLEQQ